ncbi:MAG TPA: anthranilate phosphoribosyltransferase, partial [Polyangiaceae bacterium]|nr:anthranilate phosphoribosyltransferase [Polyangiaceae bacterium]
MIAFAKAMERLLAASVLDAGLVGDAFESILAGEWTPIQVGAFASAVRVRGETAEAIGAATRALRAHMTVVEHGLPLVCDTCGTGGDGAMTLNVSTAAAIVVAACNVPVAKHGNRSISSNCGSADVIEALGVPIDLAPEKQADLLRDVNIAFLFAPAHHPALRHAAEARRELGVRTIFNALGPVANPARATHQVIGVYDDALRPMLARVLADLGSVRAWVVRSTDGLDEISPAAETRVSEVNGSEVTERTITPEDFGLARAPLEAIRGGSAIENAKSIETILANADHAAAGAVLLTAAAMLH